MEGSSSSTSSEFSSESLIPPVSTSLPGQPSPTESLTPNETPRPNADGPADYHINVLDGTFQPTRLLMQPGQRVRFSFRETCVALDPNDSCAKAEQVVLLNAGAGWGEAAPCDPTNNSIMTVRNDSFTFIYEGNQPMYFYGRSQCGDGMLGAINAPDEVFWKFQAKAMASPNSTWPDGKPIEDGSELHSVSTKALIGLFAGLGGLILLLGLFYAARCIYQLRNPEAKGRRKVDVGSGKYKVLQEKHDAVTDEEAQTYNRRLPPSSLGPYSPYTSPMSGRSIGSNVAVVLPSPPAARTPSPPQRHQLPATSSPRTPTSPLASPPINSRRSDTSAMDNRMGQSFGLRL